MKYVDCKAHAKEILNEVKASDNKKELWILTMGNDPASASYVKGKIKDCRYCGIPYQHKIATSETDLLWYITQGNNDDQVGGIIVQLPLPDGIDEQRYTDAVRIDKDVDGFKNNSPFKPCTPEGILHILHKELGDLSGKTALLIGKGKLVGRPLIDMLLDRGCTVTVAHSKTKNLNHLLWDYHDVVITAVGKPKLIDLKGVYANTVIDAGISRDANGKLCGDCFNFDPFYRPWMKVTPVPKGIGLLTRAMLMKHMIK